MVALLEKRVLSITIILLVLCESALSRGRHRQEDSVSGISSILRKEKEKSRLLVSSNVNLTRHQDKEISADYNSILNKTVILTCTLHGSELKSFSRLEWWDKNVPIAGHMGQLYSNREIINTDSCGVALKIHNFSVLDYGRYHCKCVNDYSRTGIQFDLDDSMGHHCSENEPVVNILPFSVLRKTLTNRAQQTRQDFVRLQCGSNKRRLDKNSIVWTKLTADQIVEVSSGNASIRVPIPDVDTKFLCHDRSKSEVHNIYYISPHNNEDIVYPPPTMEQVHTNYSLENVIERDGIINLCLIQPYSRQNTVSSITFKRGSTILKANASRSIELISGRSAGVSATLMSKLIGETHTGIVYFMQLHNVSETDTSLAFVRWLEGGRFSCSLNRPRKRVKVSFRLNLTTGHNAMEPLGMPTAVFCPVREMNMTPTFSLPTTVSQDDTPVTDSTFGFSTTALAGNPFLVGRASQRWDQQTIRILLSALSIVAIVIVIIAFIGGILCTKRVAKYRGRKVQKMSTQVVTFGRSQRISMSSDLHHSDSTTSDPLGDDGCITMSRKLAVADGVFVPFHLLNLKDDLGSGAFGVVKKAELVDPDSQTTYIVAVKMLKESASTEDEKDIIMELKALYHVGEHCNVVSFLGASVHEGKLHLIVEYCERGNLLQFLRSKRGDMKNPLSVQNQVAMASQVANGMAYLASKRCIHRDLAARNVLITKDLTLKVADFGLARKMYSSVYRPSGKRLPIKWMAPEGILDGVCTSKSDVWSFGILLWEIMTLGRTPYPGRSAQRVIRDIENGYRMPQPDGCPDKLYSMMKCCWQMDPTARPEFTELTNALDNVVMELDSGQLHTCYYNLQDMTSIEGCSTDVSYRSRSPSQSSLTSHMYCSYCRPASNHTSLNRTSPLDPSYDHLSESSNNGSNLLPENSLACFHYSDHSLHRVRDETSDYVNILPRGWFGEDWFNYSHQREAVSQFLQMHTGQENTLSRSLASTMEFDSGISLCSQCRLLGSSETFISRTYSQSPSIASSLCTTCKEQDYQNGLQQDMDSTSDISVSSLCTECRYNSDSGQPTTHYHRNNLFDRTSVCSTSV